MDILDSERQQRQQYQYSFLFIPGNIVNDRKLINIIQTEQLLQFQRDDGNGIRVVTLSGIQYTWNTVNIAEI